MDGDDKPALDYDALDPVAYRERYRRVPREHYLDTHWTPLLHAAIERHLRGRLLDAGCGAGKHLPTLAKVGRPIGVDLSLRWLREARASDGSSALARADACRLPFADHSFDGAISVGLLEYVDPDALLGELSRLLRPRGRAIVLVPNRESAFRRSARLLARLRGQPYHCQEPTRRQLVTLFARHGLSIVESLLDDGLIWLPDFLDRQIGSTLYPFIERALRPLTRNPWSSLMLFVVEAGGSAQ